MNKQFGHTHCDKVNRLGGLPIQPVQHGLCRTGLNLTRWAIKVDPLAI